ncbi:hypothetical protein HanRHA438_Chr15g0721881 [Helianthus annuus]|nr:hypothetical protein HanRHA438_Chr15g0721881 [Helianthus annuus]
MIYGVMKKKQSQMFGTLDVISHAFSGFFFSFLMMVFKLRIHRLFDGLMERLSFGFWLFFIFLGGWGVVVFFRWVYIWTDEEERQVKGLEAISHAFCGVFFLSI